MFTAEIAARNMRFFGPHGAATTALFTLVLTSPAMPFPLTQSLGTAGTREFHFCHLEVTPRTAACADAPDCLQFDSSRGPIWLDVHYATSPTEEAPGTLLLEDMFQYANRLSLAGDPSAISLLKDADVSARFDLHGYWYPSGRRLLLFDLRRVGER
jgi:hypothetical protein